MLGALALMLLAQDLVGGGESPAIMSTPALAAPAAAVTFTLAQSYAWPGTASRFPCVGDVASCRLYRVNSAGTALECVDNTGAACTGTTITQGTGATYFDTPFGTVKAMHDVTDAKAPSAVDATLNAAYANDITVVIAGYGTTQTAATVSEFYSGGGAGGLLGRQESGSFTCTWVESSVPVVGAGVDIADGWTISSCRRSGNNRISRVNGVDGATNTTSTTKGAATVGSTTYFGRSAAGGSPLRGPMAFVAIYFRALTAAELKALELAFWGATGLDSGGTNALVGIDNTAVSGQVDLMHSGAYLTGPAGYRTQTTNTNFWTSPLDLSADTDVGTPTVNTNVASGPLSRWKNVAEVDRLVDDDGAALEGKMGPTAGTTLGMYTASVLLAAGDTGTTRDKVRLAISTDGTLTNGVCDFSGLTATYERKVCTGTVTGSPTYIKPQVLLGNAAGDTGSVLISQRQFNRYALATLPATINTSITQNTLTRIDASAWPSTAVQGKYELVFTPKWSPISGWYATGQLGSTVYPLDVVDSTPNHSVAPIWGYTVAGRFYGVVQNGASTNANYIDSIDLTPGQQYVSSTEWYQTGATYTVVWRLNTCADASTCHAVTEIGRDATFAYVPNTPRWAYLGQRNEGSFTTSADIAALRVYQ